MIAKVICEGMEKLFNHFRDLAAYDYVMHPDKCREGCIFCQHEKNKFTGIKDLYGGADEQATGEENSSSWR